MAIVQYGPTVAGIRGTVSGVTFSANKSGPHIRLWAKGANPRSDLQMQTRSRMSLFSGPWQAMSDGDRATWDALAAAPPEEDYNTLGDRVYLSGWQWFVRINQRRLSVGLAQVTAPPSGTAATPPASVTLSVDQQPGSACTVSWPSATFGATDSAILTVAMHPTVGLLAHPQNQTLILAEYNPGDTGETITTPLTTRFGSFSTGWKVFGSLRRQTADGRRSTDVATTTEVT